MNTTHFTARVRTLAAIALTLILPTLAIAQSGGPFDLSVSSLNCGGGESAAGAYMLISSMGDASSDQPLTGGVYSISGGFVAAANARCPADFNNDGQASVQDIFDYLSAYLSGDPRADISGDGFVAVQDIFDFLSYYFAGCA